MLFTGDIAVPYKDAVQVDQNFFSGKTWIGNLEGSLVSAYKQARRGVYNDTEAIKEICKRIPFKAFVVSNNHLLDSADVIITISNLRQLGIGGVGGGCKLQDARNPLLIKDADGVTYRLLAFGWENIQCKVAKNNSQGVNPYSRGNVLSCTSDALKGGERVICFFHWNYELERYPQPYDRNLAHELIDMGVEAIIGCHAHRVQPIEFYKGKPIVYGLGNFLFCQGHYFDTKLKFPKFCQEEYAFEINKDGYRLHYFHYEQEQNRLEYVKSADISPNVEFDGKAEFADFSDKKYEKWFKKNRVQKKLLPIFYARESELSYWMKSEWIRIRGVLINLLTKMNLKSRNRANR